MKSRKTDVTAKVLAAFGSLQAEYNEEGGWRYPGPLDADEDWGWIGPYAWSEADVQHRFASFLEEQFGRRAVHLEMPINERMRSDLGPLPPENKRRSTTFIDIVVADLSGLEALPSTALEAGAAFRAREHEAFIEVKWFPRGAARWDWHEYRRCEAEVPADLLRLDVHRRAGRCSVAAVLVVDDRGTFIPQLQAAQRLPRNVLLLVLSYLGCRSEPNTSRLPVEAA